MAAPRGAASTRGGHDAPPGCAWKHGQEEYVWTPVFLTTALHHALVLVITQNSPWGMVTYNSFTKER
jgi:hypothetical protein